MIATKRLLDEELDLSAHEASFAALWDARAGQAGFHMSVTEEDVREALRAVEDPELGMDVIDLGLVYDVKLDLPQFTVTYSLTSMGCPAGALIEQQIQEVVQSMEGVDAVVTDLTWTPPWSPEMMSDDAKVVLGF